MADYEALGRRLLDAYETGSPIDPFSTDHDLSIADAYRIQSAFIADRVSRGASPIGYKLGFTNETIQQQYGVGQPAYGVLLNDTVASEPVVSVGNRIDPRIEPEIAFLLDSPLSGRVTTYDILAATREVVPVVEVVDSRMNESIEAVDAVADNALAAGLVPGQTTSDPLALDLEMEAVQLRINGRLVDAGTGSAVLGHPARAVAWLAETLDDSEESIEAGQLVSTGSLTAASPVESGDVVEARFATLGTVTFAVE